MTKLRELDFRIIIGLEESVMVVAHLTAGGCLAHDHVAQEFAQLESTAMRWLLYNI